MADTVLEAARGVHHIDQEVLEVGRHTVHIDQEVVRLVQCGVAEAAGSHVEEGHRIVGRVEDLEADLHSLPGIAGLVEGRSLAAGVL